MWKTRPPWGAFTLRVNLLDRAQPKQALVGSPRSSEATSILTPGAPTAEHKDLLQAVGSWVGTLTYFTPGQEPTPNPAQEEIVAIGGFWVQSHFSCEFMGQPYIGNGCMGYDAASKTYVSTWVDNMSSYLAVMKGQRDAKTNAIVLHYEAPNEQGVMTHYRSETIKSANSSTMTFFEGEGAGRKMMVIDMQRKKN